MHCPDSGSLCYGFTWRFSCFQDKQWLHWVFVNAFNQIALLRTKDNLLFKILDHEHERIHSRLILAWQRISPHLLWSAPLCAETKWTLARLASMSWIPLLTAACSTSLTESAWVGSIKRNLALVNYQRQMPHPVSFFFFFFPSCHFKIKWIFQSLLSATNRTQRFNKNTHFKENSYGSFWVCLLPITSEV